MSPRRTRIVPLILTWNEREGRYQITVDATNIIKPVASVAAEAR